MKTLIIYASVHHQNTEKIARAMGLVLNASVLNFFQVKPKEIKEADLIGFGSGVYFGKFHQGLIKLAQNLPLTKKKAFLFSTSGMKKNFIVNYSHNHFKKILKAKGWEIIDEFNCLGFDNFGLLRIIGGINKNRPDQQDLAQAKDFARSLNKKIKE